MEEKHSHTRIPLKQSIYHILLAVGDGEMHGYAIMQSLSEKTKGTA